LNRFVSNLAVFVLGFIACALTLKLLYGGPVVTGASKEAVLTNLSAAPSPMRHFTGESVIADAVSKVEPAVVDVHTQGKAVTVSPDPFSNDPLFRRFFGGPEGDNSQRIVPTGAGSGVIISPDGYILTNNHVVADAAKVTVRVGEKGYEARVIGTDPTTDIAIVKIDAKGMRLPAAQLGDSNALRVGDWAIAVGNPLDIGTTVTLGIISALNRKDLSAEGHPLGSVIQTDAAINPGNSGGALANINGQVIGVNEAIYSPTGSYVGIGFAIPINSARKIAAELIKNGKIVRPYLGISYAPLKGFPPQARQQMGIATTGDTGVLVQQVFPGSPADKAGLQTYDVILEANRRKITDTNTLNDIIGASKVGDTLTLLVSRNGQNRIVTVKLAERPANFGAQPSRPQQRQPFMMPGP